MPLLADPLRQAVVASLTEIEADLVTAPPQRGRPPLLSDAHLWGCTLLTILDGQPTQRAIWREVTTGDRWGTPVPVADETVRKRLVTRGPVPMAGFFAQVTALMTAHLPGETTLAPFATEVYVLDATTLDKVVRRAAPDLPRPLAGRVHTRFDLRRQLFSAIDLTEQPFTNERTRVPSLVADLPAGCLLVMDRGYTAFPLFDQLVQQRQQILTRYDKTFTAVHTLTRAHGVVDELGFCGTYRADQGEVLFRRITLPVPGGKPRAYLTSVLDPVQLPPADVARIYARRWDVEMAFATIKRGLGLHLIWSTQWPMIALQVWATLVIFQIASGIRAEIARRAGVTVFDVSMQLLLEHLPRLASGPQASTDVVGWIVARQKYGGYIRPARRRAITVPETLPVTLPPPDLPTTRPPRRPHKQPSPSPTKH